MSYKYNSQRISEILREGITQLKDLCELEDLIAKIKDIDKTVSFYSKQKKSRVAILDEEIKKLESQKETLKNIIKETLDCHNEESLSFPKVGVVRKKSGTTKWVINNEEELIASLKNSLSKEDFDSLVEMKPKISKSAIDKFFDKWQSGGSWPQGVDSFVECVKSPDSIALMLEKDFNPVPNNYDSFVENYEVDESKSLDDMFGEISEDDL